MPFPSTEGPSGEHGSALPRILFVQMRPQNDCPRSNIVSCPSGGLEVDFVDLDASLLAEQVQQQANSPSPRHRPVERGLQARQQPIPNSDAGTTGKPGSRTDETNVSYPVLNSDYHVVRHGNRGFTSPQDRSHAWIPADSVPGAGVHAPRDHLDEQVPGEEWLEPSHPAGTAEPHDFDKRKEAWDRLEGEVPQDPGLTVRLDLDSVPSRFDSIM